MSLDDSWFTEICEECGSSFSLKIKEKLHEEHSPYQRIEIYETSHYGTLMVIDGFIMLSDRDNFLYHEMLTHPALFTHPAPRDVLIIGGGDCGTLKEVLKHSEITRVQQVEIDERVTRVSEEFFPDLCSSNGDPRAQLHFADGIRWVESSPDGYYDVIVVDSTDPIGPAEGLFNEAFYRQCHRALREQGILVQQSESPLYHVKLINAMRTAMRSAGFDAVHTLDFPQPVYPSGWWSATLAGKGADLHSFRESDVRDREFSTRYYSHAMHRAATEETPLLSQALD